MRYLLLLLLLLSSAPLAGCGDSPVRERDAPDTPGLAMSRDEAVTLFTSAWEERDYTAYESLLHDGFVFYFAQEDIDRNAVPGTSWPRVEELSAANRMFGSGGTARSITAIHLTLSPVDAWSILVAPEFAGTEKRTFFVNMTLNYSNGDIGDVRGQQVLYVAPVTVTLDGEEATAYQLKYWRDLGFSEAPRGAGVETQSWGVVKASF